MSSFDLSNDIDNHLVAEKTVFGNAGLKLQQMIGEQIGELTGGLDKPYGLANAQNLYI